MMKKRHCTFGMILLMLLCSPVTRAGEIAVVIKPLNPFGFGQRQIFTPVLLLNNGSTTHNVSLNVSVMTQTGEAVADFVSASFEVRPGTMDLAAASPFLVSSTYFNPKFKQYEQANATFPSGHYTYCVQLTLDGAKDQRFCEAFEMQALNPAQLIYPENHAELEDFGSFQFSWIPCTPPRSQVYYVFKVVEMLEGQSSIEAISRNPSLYKIGGLGTTSLNYPLNAPQFEIGKHYAWQVECYEDLSKPEYGRDVNAAISSTVSDFSLIDEKIVDSVLFVKPKRTLDAGFTTLKQNRIYFTFHSDYLQGQLNYTLRDQNQKDIPVKIRRMDENGVLAESPVVFIGENKYQLELNGQRPPEGLYVMEIKDLKGIVYYIKIFIPTE